MISAYTGSQPGIVRRALSALGDIKDYALVDLGCGKGRATAVATEFPFREVIGVELSAELAATARANAAIVARRFPDRPQVTIVEANVVDFPLPPGKLVFFNYHSFGQQLIAQIIGLSKLCWPRRVAAYVLCVFKPRPPSGFRCICGLHAVLCGTNTLR